MRVNKSHSQIIFTLISSGVMALLMSGVMTLVNRGLVENFLGLWGNAFLISWVVSFPASMLIIPRVRSLVDQMTQAVEKLEGSDEITSVAA